MDNPISQISDRSTSLSNGPSFRRSTTSRPISVNTSLDSSHAQSLHIPVVTVIVNKDEHGYGMKVSGDNPVYVQSVKEGGAAERAGLHSGDKIIKVNGVNVTQSTHTEVVALIKSSTQVVLAVQQRPSTSPRPVSAAMTSPSLHARPLHHHHSAPTHRSTDRITSPQPIDIEARRQLDSQRVYTYRLMLEKEQRYADGLRSQLARSNEPKTVQELTGAERRIKTLQEQLDHLIAQAQNPDHEYSYSPHSFPKIPSPSGSLLRAERGELEVPPPLPLRNRPCPVLSFAPPYGEPPPPPVPPRHYCPHLHCPEGGDSVHLLPPTNCYAVNSNVTPLHTHQRTKSSPDNMQNLSIAEVTRRLIASESMSDLSGDACLSKSKNNLGRSSWDMDSPRVTPPGTPPPPYGGGCVNPIEGVEAHHEVDQLHEESVVMTDAPSPDVSPLRNSNGSFIHHQHPIIMSMEDDEISDQEVSQLDDHGPFKSLNKLWEHNAHLAVFMNYVISNSDPSSLLFYLVTDLYKEGNAKEMKKWAYEIHSSFLVPFAPLRLNNVDENVAREIDDVLLKESDKEEILRKIFWKARVKAKEELNEQLADFQQKRTAGLGTIFGPPDAQLDESIHDKSKETKIVESILLPKIEPYLDDIEKDQVDPRRYTTAAALGTVIGKVFGLRGTHASTLLDRCPTFVSKDKSLKARLIGKTRKVNVRGHHFVLHQYYTVTYCNHCQNIIWGIGPQGYQCSDCSLNIHRTCVKVLDENCPGPLTKKEKGNDRISKLMEKIRPEREARRKPSSLALSQFERMKRHSEDDTGALTDGESGTGDRPVSGGRSGGGERRPDPVRESEERPNHDGLHNEDDIYHPDIHHVPKKPTSASINRSESYKERVHQKRQLRERRKTSDPNLSKTNDVDLDNQGLSYNTNSGSSSNSSLSTRSLDSPSNSLEMVTGPRTQEAVTVTLTPNSSGALYDSDLEAEPDPPDWGPRGVDLKNLSDKEKKRQDVINELFHSERSHVRHLKVLDQVFYRPMLDNQVLPSDHIQLLFSNLDQMLDIHSQFNNKMKSKRRESHVVTEVADLLFGMFDGPAGEEFQRAAATFCARQQIALELLKERRRKDAKLNNFLTDAEGNPLCRRLQLKDIIPTGMQRLTKYPLLFENLAKHTEEGTEELSGVQRALERSKEILNHVNQAKREAEDHQRLSDIMRRLDRSGFEKVDHPMAGEFKNLDLTKHRLIHEGPLNWRIGNRQKLIDLHVLLLEDVIILLQKQDEKFVLKFYNMNTAGGGVERSPTLSPIIKVSTVLVRHNAVDKKALYLVNTSQNGAQIYDLVATSSAERKIWFRHISEAAEAYKTRDGKNRRPEPLVAAPTHDEVSPEPSVQEKTKDSEETSNEVGVKEEGAAGACSDLLAPPGGSTSSTTLDAESSPVSASPSESPSTTPQASPSSVPSDNGEASARKIGDGLLLSSPSQRRRIEPLRLTTEESSLIQPSEVVVSQRPVLTAEPVLTPIEKLRRKDEEIRLALAEKTQLVADILHVPREEFETIAELAGEPSVDKEATELVLAAVNQANHLTSILNEVLRVTEEDAVSATSEVISGSVVRRSDRLPAVPAHKLQDISSSLNKQLTQLLKIVRDRDEERERLRRELQRSREQLHCMHESQRRQQNLNLPTSPTPSRPSSYVSVGSSSEQPHDSEEDTGLNRLLLVCDQEEDVVLELEDKHATLEPHEEAASDVFVDALSGEAENHLEGVVDESSCLEAADNLVEGVVSPDPPIQD